jgi:hypothetical protein
VRDDERMVVEAQLTVGPVSMVVRDKLVEHSDYIITEWVPCPSLCSP